MIVGAGLAGLIAASVFPKTAILEAGSEPQQQHHALLRFRSRAVADLVGIDFEEVTVRKGLWWRGEFRPATIDAANAYARKVVRAAHGDRSVWSLDTVQRWVAPEDFYWRLVDMHYDRIAWSSPFDFSCAPAEPVISTAPLPQTLASFGIDASGAEFSRAPISVQRYRVPGARLHQTVYFPSAEHALYRASMTGDLLICEFVDCFKADVCSDTLQRLSPLESDSWEDELQRAFQIPLDECTALGEVSQRYGKIVPLADVPRRALLRELTERFGVYSLGRFATWRNVLLDDVVHDAFVIKRMIAADAYGRAMMATSGAKK